MAEADMEQPTAPDAHAPQHRLARLPPRTWFVAALTLGGLLAAVAVCGPRDHNAAFQSSGSERFLLSAEEVPCAGIKRGVDFATREQLPSISGILSAAACRDRCQALPRCGAWTWGEKAGIPGVTHTCFPKVLAVGEQPREVAKPEVVSGRPCRAPAAAARPRQGAACGQLDNVDLATRAELPPVNGVTSAEVCKAACRAAPGCAAWTWGKARNIPGLSDRCFLKKLANGEQPRHVPKVDVVSGLVCAPSPAAGGAAAAPGGAAATTAPPAATTAPPAATAPPRHPRRSSMLYCITLALASGREPALLRMHHQQHSGIFACDRFTVYSNESFGSDAGIEVSLLPMSLHSGSRGELQAHASRGSFRELWRLVLEEGSFWLYDWTVKVDPATVFLPSRLRPMLHGYKEELDRHQHGLYFNNCRFGLRGAIEVFSSAAVQALGDGWQECETHFQELCSGNCRWGEDLFVDQCMSEVFHVRREYLGGLLIDESCGPPKDWQSCREEVTAFHPITSAQGFMDCLSGAGQRVDAVPA